MLNPQGIDKLAIAPPRKSFDSCERKTAMLAR